jgi:hypothetical protein
MSRPQPGRLPIADRLFSCRRSAGARKFGLELAVTFLKEAPYMERGQCEYARWTPFAPYAAACGGFA